MKITKKNGTITLYDDEKVTSSILKANANIPGEDISPAMAAAMANQVFDRLTKDHDLITTVEVRTCVAALLQENDLSETARCYLEYVK